MSSEDDCDNLMSELEEYMSKLNIPNPSEVTKKSQELMKKKLEEKIDSLIEKKQKELDLLSQKSEIDVKKEKEKIDEINANLQKLKDEAELIDKEKKEELEQSLNRSRNNINLAEENYKKAAEAMSQNIERLKIIKDKISKSNETNEKKE